MWPWRPERWATVASAPWRGSAALCSTAYQDLADIRSKMSAPPAGGCKPGGGRKSKASDLALVADLKRLVEPSTRGVPSKPFCGAARWNAGLNKSMAYIMNDIPVGPTS